MTVPTLVSGLPDGPTGHGTVDPRRLDPDWSLAGRRAFAAAVACGDVTVPDVENFDGDGPYGLDRGVAPLAYDLFAAGCPRGTSRSSPAPPVPTDSRSDSPVPTAPAARSTR